MFKVHELIKVLSEFNPTAEVVVNSNSGNMEITDLSWLNKNGGDEPGDWNDSEVRFKDKLKATTVYLHYESTISDK
jgi:hypothetical protein